MFYEIKGAILSFAAPLWVIFVLQYTGRERWLKRTTLTLLFAVPAATLTLILAGGVHSPIRSFDGLQNAGSSMPVVSYSTLFWAGFTYAAFLVLVGAALLILILVNSQSLYGKQSLCLLLGFVGPWTACAAYASGLYRGIGSLPGLNPMVIALPPRGWRSCGGSTATGFWTSPR